MDAVGFLGEYSHTLDEKGRVFIPKRFIQALPGDEPRVLYVTRGLDGCLALYTTSAWKAAAEQVRSKPEGDESTRHFRRLFFSFAQDLALDGSNRVLIPERHRQVAGLGRDVVFVGVSDHIELWDKVRWDEVMTKASNGYDAFARGVLT